VGRPEIPEGKKNSTKDGRGPKTPLKCDGEVPEENKARSQELGLEKQAPQKSTGNTNCRLLIGSSARAELDQSSTDYLDEPEVYRTCTRDKNEKNYDYIYDE